ncbi:ATP-binding protein [Alkalihalobacterium bogoriense]|uniref:ATP-binding protein n=1 Tax=Alkalihalobacterium bogoriense TaxID=246272 RepID=UPI00047B10DD|nr:AAA family ATPase [Alkalihalobacterium bogoriense]
MNILSLTIYGFGKFQNQNFDHFSEGLHLFYGKNEAGKSTILAFIRSVLYGFPQKTKSNRFEPKTGTTYGGKITLFIQHHGIVTIERVRGKAGGDVTVYFENGQTAGEESLTGLLGGVDRTSFYGIFTFNLSDLQGLDQLDKKEWAQYLHGVSVAGRVSITDLEKQIVKKQQELFKPSGKKPLINETLGQIEAIERKIYEKEKDLESYQLLQVTEKQIEENLQSVKEKRITCLAKIKEYEKLSILAPLLRKRAYLEAELAVLPKIEQFPVHGVEQFEQLLYQRSLIEEKKIELKQKRKSVNETIQLNKPNEKLLEVADKIEAVKEDVKLYEIWKREKQALTITMEQEQQKWEEIQMNVGQHWTKEKVMACDTSIEVKDSLRQLNKEQRRLEDRKYYLDSELQKRQLLLEEHEKEFSQCKEEQLPTGYRIELENKRKSWVEFENSKQREREHEETYKIVLTQLEQARKRKKRLFLPLSVFFCLIAVYSFLQEQWLLFFVALSSSIAFFVASVEKKNQIESKAKKEESFREDLADIENVLNYDDAVKERLLFLEKKLQLEQQHYTHLCNQLDECEYEQSVILQKIEIWCQENGYDVQTKSELLLAIVSLIEEGKKVLAQLKRDEQRLHDLSSYILSLEKSVEVLASKVGIEFENVTKTVFILFDQLENEKEKRRAEHQATDIINGLNEDIRILLEKETLIQNQIETLLHKANVQKEDEFQKKGVQIAKAKKYNDELEFITSQLSELVESEDEIHYYIQLLQQEKDYENQKQQLEELVAEVEKEEKEERERLIRNTQQMEQLQSERELASLVQELELKKARLLEQAKNWSVYRLAQEMLEKTKEIYENERQPEVMKQASAYFSAMTAGRYQRIFAPMDKQMIVVERQDGLRFSPEELSRGTAEQLYISIRFALAMTYESNDPFPLILDDIFVNFDDERKQAIVTIIEELAQKRQVLFFTCHDNVKELFVKKDVITL